MVIDLSNRLYDIAYEQNMKITQVNVSIMKAKLEAVNNKFDNAIIWYDQAISVAESAELTNYLEYSNSEKYEFIEGIAELQKSIQQSDIVETMQKVQLLQYAKKAQRIASLSGD